jgi:Putative Actinobacterial Holin-X, holin superfamily III
MLSKVKHSAARAARKAGMVSAGALCVLVGAGFLTGASWIFLATAYGTLIAASVIGAAYAGIGLLLVGLAGSDEPHQDTAPEPEPTPAPASSDAPPLLQAFLFGLQAGASSDRR